MPHGRISTLTKSYVLSPYNFELEIGYDGAVVRFSNAGFISSDGRLRWDCRRAPIAPGVLYPFFGILPSRIIAGVAMSFSSVSVIENALRLRGLKL